MLVDQTTYDKLKKDPTRKYKADLSRMIYALEKEEKITKEQYWYLYPTLEKSTKDIQISKNPQGGCATLTNSRLHTDNRIQGIQRVG